MKSVSKIICAVILLMMVNACVQDEAEVSNKGNEFFGRVHDHEGALDSPSHQTFPEDSPRIKPGYSRPVEPAQVQSVGVTDLAPPKAAASQPPAFTQPPAQTLVPAAPPQSSIAPPARQSQAAAASQFIWPVSGGTIISHFGPKAGGRSNDGINVAVTEGEPIWAAAGGKVVYAGSDLKGYGNMIIVRHKDGWMTAYAHARSIAVKKEQMVKQGDIIAYVGMSGGVPSPQLHFAIRHGRTPVDPELYLSKNFAG